MFWHILQNPLELAAQIKLDHSGGQRNKMLQKIAHLKMDPPTQKNKGCPPLPR